MISGFPIAGSMLCGIYAGPLIHKATSNMIATGVASLEIAGPIQYVINGCINKIPKIMIGVCIAIIIFIP